MTPSRRCRVGVVLVGILAAACSSAPPPKPARVRTAPPPPVYRPDARTAFWIEPSTSANSNVCGGMAWEWRRFELKEKSGVSIDLRMSHDRSDVDLFLYDDRVVQVPPSGEIRAQSRGIGAEEHIREEVGPGVYYVQVLCYGDGRAEEVGYALTVNVREMAAIDEPKKQAYPVRESSKGQIGRGYRYKSRWYHPTFKERGTLIIDFRPQMERGELQFELRSESDALIAMVRSATTPETLRVPVSAGAHYFRLETSDVDATGSFAFSFEVQLPPPTPVASRPVPLPVITPPPKPAPPPVPAEAPRSQATPLLPHGNSVALGEHEPAAKWYSFNAPKRSHVTIDCNCEGESVTLELYRNGSDKPIATGSSIVVVVDPGRYEVRASTKHGPGSGTLRSQINTDDADSHFTKVPKKKKDGG